MVARLVSILFLGGVLLGVTPSAAAQAEASPGERTVRFPPTAFLPTNSGTRYAVELGGLGPLCVLEGAAYFVAPLRPENDARIVGITAFVRSTNQTSSALLSLARRGVEAFEIVAMTPLSRGTEEIEALSTDVTQAAGDEIRKDLLLQILLTGPGVCLHGAEVRYDR